MVYVASVNRSSFPAHVHQDFTSKAKAIAWAKSQSGYNSVVYERIGWKNVWTGK